MSFKDRLGKLQHALSLMSCDALVIDDAINIFYMTGLNLSAGKLLIHLRGAHLIVDTRYYEICKKGSPFPVLESEKHSLETVLASSEFDISSLGFDSDKTSHKTFLSLINIIEKVNINRLNLNASLLQLIPLDSPLKSLRSIKDTEEIALLREAAILGSQGFDFACSLLKEGITELEVAIALEIFWKQRGGRNVAFDPIIAFGANSSMPHYRAGNQYLKVGDPVLIDIGVCLNRYHSDMTRMFYFGEPDPRIRTIHAIVAQAQQTALTLCRPGTLLGDLDLAAREVIAAAGYGEYFTHSLGHGIGLEIHEFPIIKNILPYKDVVLEAGMAITIEPGIYLPGVGGVRIEDTVVITNDGHENLTRIKTM
ncbi:MAG: aminopeptidase P family protein [Parachlamydiaceae bacterium]|nr:aminopeptidase P family protein [Parachlamydiaceae bacterium]